MKLVRIDALPDRYVLTYVRGNLVQRYHLWKDRLEEESKQVLEELVRCLKM